MTNPAEHAHDSVTGAPAEGAQVGKSELGEDAIPNADHPVVTGDAVDAAALPAVDPVIAEKADGGFSASTGSLIEPFMGEDYDGQKWVPVKFKNVKPDSGGYVPEYGKGVYTLDGKALNPKFK